jgi:hypothetical protein
VLIARAFASVPTRLALAAVLIALTVQTLRHPESDFWRGAVAGAVIGVCGLVALARWRRGR